jgi:thioredoxin reductase (NADPH)
LSAPREGEHHTAIVVGGGPGGLPLAVVLGGWHPYYRESARIAARYPGLAQLLAGQQGTLLGMDLAALVRMGVAPGDLFRLLHHPQEEFRGLDDAALEFRRGEPLDVLLLTREDVGGLWNNVPHNLLTLSPGHWMEFAFYPLAQFAAETGRSLDPNALILKRDLVDYYHAIPERFGVADRIRTWENVERIEPHPRGFRLETRHVRDGSTRHYTCRYLVYAAGQRCRLRYLDVPGEDLAFVTHHYDRPEDFPGETVVVVGGGRSGDWAATELYDAGKRVSYVMRQEPERHWRLINDSRHNLPYYRRIAQILESGDPRMEPLYHAHVERFDTSGTRGRVTVAQNGSTRVLETDHAVLEIGGLVDYSLFQGFPPIQLVEKHDRYRFQCHQARTHPHNYESIDIPNLYLGGYLAEGLGLVVISMHGAGYAIAGDILQREGAV